MRCKIDRVTYTLTIAGWSVNSADDSCTELVELDARLSMLSPDDCCRVSVYAPPAPQPGLLEQAVGAAVVTASEALGLGGEGGTEEEAYSVLVRGQAIKLGNPITIQLTAGDISDKVMTARERR